MESIHTSIYTYNSESFCIRIPKKRGDGFLKSAFGWHHRNRESELFDDIKPSFASGDYSDIEEYLHIDIKVNITYWDDDSKKKINQMLSVMQKVFPYITKFVFMDWGSFFDNLLLKKTHQSENNKKAESINLKGLVCPLPFRGKGGKSKKTGCCPRCGANNSIYRYPENRRWKHCFMCGYDRSEERLLKHIRYEAKRGRNIDPKLINRVLKYHATVYGAYYEA